MKYKNHMKLEFPSNDCNESFARTAVACFASQLDPTLEELGDIRTAVSEAVNNCIIHAYPEGSGIIILRCRILKDSILDIVIKDRGVGIPESGQSSITLPFSGMGFVNMVSLMSSFSVFTTPGKGTTVHMKKRIRKQ